MYNKKEGTLLYTILDETIISDNYDLDILGFNYAFTKPQQSCDILSRYSASYTAG